MFVRTIATREARRAFTLVELVVVIAILVVVAGLVIESTSGVLAGGDQQEGVRVKVTRVSMERVRDAITGEPDRGFKQDMGEIPRYLTDLFIKPTTLLSGNPAPSIDLAHDRGWNGPYLARSTGYYHIDIPRGFTADYGAETDPAVFDAWPLQQEGGSPELIRSPIVLQIPRILIGTDFTLQQKKDYARLVSAGPNGRIDTQITTLDPDITHNHFDTNDPQDVGDDVVVFLYRANGPGP